jgi:hypothetical protein
MTSGKSSKMAGSDVISASRNTHLSTAREELNRNGAGTMSSVAADSPSTNHDKNMHHTSLKLGFPRQLPSYFANFAMGYKVGFETFSSDFGNMAGKTNFSTPNGGPVERSPIVSNENNFNDDDQKPACLETEKSLKLAEFVKTMSCIESLAILVGAETVVFRT